MRTVWKHQIPVDDDQHEIPGQVIHVEREGPGSLTVWSVVEVVTGGFPTLAPETRFALYRVIGTGHKIPASLKHEITEHAGTVMDGPYVWHLFRIGWER